MMPLKPVRLATEFFSFLARIGKRPGRIKPKRRARRYRVGDGLQLEERLALSTVPAGFVEVPLAAGLKGPTAMAVAPDGRIFVAQQDGTIRIIGKNGLRAQPFAQVDTVVEGERGLTGIALDPRFSSNGFVYVYYASADGEAVHARVSRLRAVGNVASAGSERVLLDLPPSSPTRGNHFGGALHFGRDGKLYIGVGDDGDGSNAPSLATPFGKMLRINANGSIPANNPFARTATGVNRAIWATGLRNPFTFAITPGTGQILINDVGQDDWEEINVGRAGANYGWPGSEGPTSTPGVDAPIFAYPHGSGDTRGFGITGGVVAQANRGRLPRAYRGQYFFADLANDWIRTLDLRTGLAQTFATGLPNLTIDLDLDARGLLYLSRGNGQNGGSVTRIVYAGPRA